MNHLLFADNMALLADSEEKLCQFVEEFGQVCRSRNLRVNNNNKCKVMNVPWGLVLE